MTGRHLFTSGTLKASSRPYIDAPRVRLGEIAVLRGGFVPSATESRERKWQEEEERLRVAHSAAEELRRDFSILPSAIQPNGTVAWEQVSPVLPVRAAERFLIREGDLLLPLRSQRIQTVVARNVPAGVLAVGQWALITPLEGVADSDFLAWYLNHPTVRARLVGTMVGTSLQFLTVAGVRDFVVDLPDLVAQRSIGRVAALTAQVGRLERGLADARQQLADEQLMAAVNGSQRRTVPSAPQRPSRPLPHE